jgi:hypothetical protein
MAVQAKKRILRDYSWETITDQYLEIFNRHYKGQGSKSRIVPDMAGPLRKHAEAQSMQNANS